MLGFDIGDVWIGVAASDALGLTAQGLPTIKRLILEDDLDQIIHLISERAVSKLVVGMPKNMNGSIGFQGEKTQEFIRQLIERIQASGKEIPEVVFWDERLTTVAANRLMLDAGLSRKKRKASVDRLAAVLILQGYLDYLWNEKNRNESRGSDTMADDLDRMDEEEIVLVDDDGEEHTFIMLDAIEVEGSQYAILQPTDDDLEDDMEPEAVILKIEFDENGDEILTEIDDDDEWEKVVDIWQDIMEEDGE